jgi:type II secretory pathway component GspD/PulD (secretin)
MKRLFLHIFLFSFLLLSPGHLYAEEAIDLKKDINLRQIAIETMVVEIRNEDTRNLGLSYTFNRDDENNPGNSIKAVDVNFPFTPDVVKIPTFADSDNDLGFLVGNTNRLPGLGFRLSGMDVGMGTVSANLRMLLQSGKAEIRAHTIAVSLHNYPVTIETVDEVPFQDVKYTNKGVAKLDVSNERVGVKLRATPKIIDLKKGRIKLEIKELDLSSVTGYVTLQNVNRPVFAKSSANTVVEMTSGETFILGGFNIKRDVVQESGIPFLRRIPILGYLFKSEKKVQEKRDIFFFITPYMLDPGVSPILPTDFKHGEFLDIRNIPVNY